MRKALPIVITLISTIISAQAPDKFEAIESTAGAPIEIVKSFEYNIGFSGDEATLEYLVWKVEDNTLKISSAKPNQNYEQVKVTVYTPSFSVLSASNGGNVVVDEKFSRMKALVVSAEDGVEVDLSKIDFDSLIISSGKDTHVNYKSAKVFVSTNSKYGLVEKMKK